ncbi:hypothetical protein L1887_56622 [Cichorium endivia]|nr:hypothetical protein L1887_56622 [Cichorium endivia]
MSRAPRWRVRGGNPKEEQKKVGGEKGAVIYLDQFPEALEIQTGSENHWCYLALRFDNKEGTLLDPFPSLPHCSSKCATPYEDLLPFCPLSVHTVLKAEEEGWAAGTNVVEWNSRRVTRSTVPRFEVQVVMITPGYALAPLTGTPEPANARENPGRSVLHSSDRRCG